MRLAATETGCLRLHALGVAARRLPACQSPAWRGRPASSCVSTVSGRWRCPLAASSPFGANQAKTALSRSRSLATVDPMACPRVVPVQIAKQARTRRMQKQVAVSEAGARSRHAPQAIGRPQEHAVQDWERIVAHGNSREASVHGGFAVAAFAVFGATAAFAGDSDSWKLPFAGNGTRGEKTPWQFAPPCKDVSLAVMVAHRVTH